MEKHPMNVSLPAGKEKVTLGGTYRSRYRGFILLIICCGFLLAAFAVSAVMLRGEGGGSAWGSFWGKDPEEENTTAQGGGQTNEAVTDEPMKLPEQEMPEGAIPVCTMDLSYLSLGREYVHNETLYRPNVDSLLTVDTSRQGEGDAPLVLILHTHTSESYLPEGTEYLTTAPGDVTYSRDAEENVLSVGEVLCRSLNANGITAIHCTTLHDEPTFTGAYDRTEATVRRYLETYPSIEYVIDLHRDSVMTSDGKFVRAAVDEGADAIAQVMAVIGTDGNGTQHERWESNLALALQLREALNNGEASICRPVSLRNASFHQELARHSILLEIGTAANSVEEARRAAVLVGEALAEIIKK